MNHSKLLKNCVLQQLFLFSGNKCGRNTKNMAARFCVQEKEKQANGVIVHKCT